MALWGKKAPGVHTNAPRHWPKVELRQFDVPALNVLEAAVRLKSLPSASLAMVRDFVYEDGILRVPLVVEEAGEKTCVFFYGPEPGAAAHYSGARSLLRARENAKAVYYGPEALVPTKAGEVLQQIDTPLFSIPASPPEDASYALWWSTSDAPSFGGSEEQAALDRWFEALDGYGFLLLTAFLKDLDLVENKEGLYALPEQPLLQPLTGPGGTAMLLHASAEDGLFLAFDESTPAERRRVLLHLLARFAAGYRAAIEARGLAPREEEGHSGVARWREIRDAALEKERSGASGLRVHGVSVRGGQPSRSPHASSAAERAAQPAAPGREELDFAMDVVDRVIADVARGAAQGSTREALGGPNFMPVVLARVGGDVVERQLPFEDAATAEAAGTRALDEWPEADVVATLCDAAIRENGERTDIVSVRVEHRTHGRAATLFQRYRVAAGGRIEPFGNPSASPAPPFLSEPVSPREPAPEAALVSLGQQAVEAIVSTFTILDPSGLSEGDDPDATLCSPSALVGPPGGGKPTLVRFMMQGPITAAASCVQHLAKEPAEWVVFHLDDLVRRNGEPDRRLRLCVQRKTDAQAAIFDQRYETPRRGRPFTLRGEIEFRRWGGSLFPAPPQSS